MKISNENVHSARERNQGCFSITSGYSYANWLSCVSKKLTLCRDELKKMRIVYFRCNTTVSLQNASTNEPPLRGCLLLRMINYRTMNMHERAPGMLGRAVCVIWILNTYKTQRIICMNNAFRLHYNASKWKCKNKLKVIKQRDLQFRKRARIGLWWYCGLCSINCEAINNNFIQIYTTVSNRFK